MTLPKRLVFEATEATDDTLVLEDEATGYTLNFVCFGEFSFQNRHYLFGMKSEDYDQCFGNQNRKEMPICLLEAFEHDDGETTYSADVSFQPFEEPIVFGMIKQSLEAVVVASKYHLQ